MYTNISNGLNKNIIIFAVIVLGLAIVAGAIVSIAKKPRPNAYVAAPKVDSLLIERNSAELNNLDIDLVSFATDEMVIQELDGTLNEVGEIEDESADLTSEAENLNNLDKDLNSSSSDELTNQEVDQTLQEAAL